VLPICVAPCVFIVIGLGPIPIIFGAFSTFPILQIFRPQLAISRVGLEEDPISFLEVPNLVFMHEGISLVALGIQVFTNNETEALLCVVILDLPGECPNLLHILMGRGLRLIRLAARGTCRF